MPDGTGISRRRFIVGGAAAAAVGGGALATWIATGDTTTESGAGHGGHRPGAAAADESSEPTGPTESPTPRPDGRLWSDPANWPDGGVPEPGSVVHVDSSIVLDIDVEVAGLVIGEEGALTFDPGSTRSLVTHGNVMVHGTLAMAPARADVDHSIVFVDVDESAFVGDVMDAPETDVGLWVMHGGVLDLAGTPRRGWSHATASLRAGANTVEVVDEPLGWQPGDELVITPTGVPVGDNSEPGFEVIRIDTVSGNTVTLAEPLRHDHPTVVVGNDTTMAAEVLNLTRNVRVEGTEGGRAHVMIHGTVPQAIRHAAFRHLGPREPDGDGGTVGYIGRYPLHFHLCQDGSRGSMVEGTVVRDGGNHAFVPHTSHGITFADCISYDTIDDAYWWDQAPDTRTPGPPTHDVVYERCVAALVRSDPPYRGFRLSGFALSRGNNNIVRGCVAVGVQGTSDASGYSWPEGSEGVWVFEDCVTHHSLNGLFVWQNTERVHTITDFVAYHNHAAGINHGAYVNPYLYERPVLYGNTGGAVILHAVSRGEGLRFEGAVCDAAGLSDYLVVSARHVAPTNQPTLFTGGRFAGARTAAFGMTYEGENGGGEADVLEIVDAAFEGNAFWFADDIHPDTRIMVQDATHGDVVVRRHDQTGELNSAWNASVA